MEPSTLQKVKIRLPSKFLKKKLKDGRVKSVHVEYVKLTCNMKGLFERTVHILLSFFTFLCTFLLSFLCGMGCKF